MKIIGKKKFFRHKFSCAELGCVEGEEERGLVVEGFAAGEEVQADEECEDFGGELRGFCVGVLGVEGEVRAVFGE